MGIMFLLIAALANGEVGKDPMQKFWWPKDCADGWMGSKMEMESTAGPQCCNTLAPPDNPFGRPCVFPFQYKDVEYNACTYVESEWLWCATEVDEDGDMVPNRYGDCDIMEWPYSSGNFSCPFTKCEPGSTWITGPPYKKTCMCQKDGVAICEPNKGINTTKEATETTPEPFGPIES